MADDEAEIRRLLAQYCQLLDDGSFDEWITLFNGDIEFVVMGMHKHGPEEEADGHQVAMAGVSRITVTVTSADGLRTRTYRVLNRCSTQPNWMPLQDRPNHVATAICDPAKHQAAALRASAALGDC